MTDLVDFIAAENLQFRWSSSAAKRPDSLNPLAEGLFFPPVRVSAHGVLLLRGPSGSGKSTLLGLLAGLLTPSAPLRAPHTPGRVVVAGQDLAQLRPAERDRWRARTLGFLPQRLHLDPALDVLGNVLLPGFAAGVPIGQGRALEVLGQLGVADLARRKPAQLSVGQAQRVALARALVRQPPVLMADEPSASLDDEAAADVARLLLAAGQSATLVVATHDARLVQAITAARPDTQTLSLERAPMTPEERLT
jgi:putative ABC transport system ATP-binding protein